jgi:hypothetical protein
VSGYLLVVQPPTQAPTASSTPTLIPTATASPTATVSPTSTVTVAPTALPGHVGIYPNPVSGPAVNIVPPSFNGISNVRVEIYTLAFRKVQDTTYSSQTSGTAITLNLTGKSGNPLSNGIYYVVVTTSSGRAVGKMLVLR